MKSYKEYLISSKSPGEEVDLIRKPIYRGSAIFPVISNSQIDSRVLFMGYWIIKNNIKELGLLYTLRNQSGKIILRKSDQISSSKSVQITIKELLSINNLKYDDFIGSIELEVFSSRNLVFPYPAFVINYYNIYSSTVVHTTGRVYNDFEDLKDNESKKVKESGFDIFSGKDIEPYFSFVNGPIEFKKSIINIELFNSNKCIVKKEITIDYLKKFETKFIYLKEFIDIDKHLNGAVGTVKIKHQLSGFFPRFVAGNFNKRSNSYSITHSYYDNSDNISKDAYWINKHQNKLYDSTVFIPLLISDDWYTELKLYPVYSPSNHKMSIEFFNMEGELINRKDNFMSITKNESKYIQVSMNSLTNDINYPKKNIVGAKIIMDWKDKTHIPTRLKYGLNIGKLNQNYNLPTNICFAPSISNINIVNKKGAFRWFPLVNVCNSIAIIDNSSFVKNYNNHAHVKINFFNDIKNNTIERSYTIPPNGQIRIKMDKELKRFSKENPIWVTVKSDNPFIKAWYFDLNENGIMGGDHSF